MNDLLETTRNGVINRPKEMKQSMWCCTISYHMRRGVNGRAEASLENNRYKCTMSKGVLLGCQFEV